MHATCAAVEEVILPGGGVALLRATEALKKVKTQNEDQKHGVEIVRKAIQTPAHAQNDHYEDLVKKGIVDPTKVVRCALQDRLRLPVSWSPRRRWWPNCRRRRPQLPRCLVAAWGGMDY